MAAAILLQFRSKPNITRITMNSTENGMQEDHSEEVLRRMNARSVQSFVCIPYIKIHALGLNYSPLCSFSELICEVLVNFGVTHIFGGHGGAVVGLVDAIVSHPKLTWVYTRCEVRVDTPRIVLPISWLFQLI